MQCRIYEIEVGGQRHPFAVPNNELAVSEMQRTLAGQSYPLPPRLPLTVETVLDVGANIGAAALYFHSHFPQARLLCVEPSPLAFPLLQRNLEALPQATLLPYGLAAQAGERPLYRGTLSTLQGSLAPSHETRSESDFVTLKTVRTMLVEGGVQHVDLLKLDTEGCEVEILDALLDALTDPIPLIYYEYHSDQDRIALDQRLHPTHLLFHMQAPMSHRGLCGYIHREVAAREPLFSQFEIDPL